MRMLVLLILLLLACWILAGCHDGYHSYGYNYRSGPPVHHDTVVYDVHHRHHHHHRRHHRHYSHCDY